MLAEFLARWEGEALYHEHEKKEQERHRKAEENAAKLRKSRGR